MCNVHDVPLATNAATACFIVDPHAVKEGIAPLAGEEPSPKTRKRYDDITPHSASCRAALGTDGWIEMQEGRPVHHRISADHRTASAGVERL